MATTTSVATITAWDNNGNKVQCDPRQFKSLQKSGYSLKDPALEVKPVDPVTTPVNPVATKTTAAAKPAHKPAAKPAAKK